jgi:hypothetical protein
MRMRHNAPIEPLLLTHVGLRTPILLMHSLKEDDSCLKNDPIGDYYATFQLPAISSNRLTSYYLLDKGIAQSIDGKWHGLLMSWTLDGRRIIC